MIFQSVSEHLRSSGWEDHYKGNQVPSKFITVSRSQSPIRFHRMDEKGQDFENTAMKW